MKQTTQNKQEQSIYKNIYCPVCNKITRQVKNNKRDVFVCGHKIVVGKSNKINKVVGNTQ